MLQGMLLLFLSLAVFFDYKKAKIPNWLCLIFGGIGLGMHVVSYGTNVAFALGKQALLIFAVLFPFWLWKVLGGGDVKIFMTAALYLGERVFHLLFLGIVATAVYSVFLMASRGNFLERMQHFYCYVRDDVGTRGSISYPFDRDSQEDCQSGGVLVSVGVLAGYLVGRVMGLL